MQNILLHMNFVIFVKKQTSMKLISTTTLLLSFIFSHGQDSIPVEFSPTMTPPISIDSFQQVTTDSTKIILGLVENKDGKIDLLIEDYLANKNFSGYRIQIFSSSNKWDAVQVKSDFIRSFPTIKSYLVYQTPNFKVHVGDYLDRLKAHQVLNEVKVQFPSAFLVIGEVDPKH
ncbi:MAG: hypothetical protein ACI9DK_001275 [Vicingaceae bacterium]